MSALPVGLVTNIDCAGKVSRELNLSEVTQSVPLRGDASASNFISSETYRLVAQLPKLGSGGGYASKILFLLHRLLTMERGGKPTPGQFMRHKEGRYILPSTEPGKRGLLP